MDSSSPRLFSNRASPALAALASIISLFITFSSPAAAETPNLGFYGFDMAPGIIYLGDAHGDEMNDIVMLKITVNTTYSEGVTLNSMIVHRTGNASDADAENLSLYMDINLNGELDISTDPYLFSGGFEQGQINFSVEVNVTPTNPLTLLLVLNVSGEAASGKTIGVSIPTNESIITKENADIEFLHPCYSKNSTIQLDIDGDLNPDETDPDDDNDGYLDVVEISCGSDPKDYSSVPKDTDKDYVPDSMDADDDNDGVPDEYDDFPLDASRQRDYTVVYIYAVIAAVLIIALILLRMKGKPIDFGKKAMTKDESKKGEEDFDIDLDLDEDLDKGLDENFNKDLDKSFDEGFDGEL